MAKRGNFRFCFRNPSHDKSVFTESEQLYADILKQHGIPFTHETKITFRNDMKTAHCWLDFLIGAKRISVEINPSWHERYLEVVERDKVKTQLLRTRQHIRTLVIRVHGKIRNKRWKPFLNLKDVVRSLRIIKEAQISPECLDFYLKR